MNDRVEVVGEVDVIVRERGKLVRNMHGHNIWTMTGREYLAHLMSYASGVIPGVPSRNDRIAYIGCGSGASPQVASVTRLAAPLAWNIPLTWFLAPLVIPPEYPTASSVRYMCAFDEFHFSGGGTVNISEFGLFTDGDPAQSFTPGTRKVEMTYATDQAPCAYHVENPFPKSSETWFAVYWTIRF